MNNEDVRMTQWGMLMVLVLNGSLALLMKFAGLKPEWWVMMLCLAVFAAVMLFCMVLLRGWMPKDKTDWDNFAVSCHRHFKEGEKL